MNIEIAHTVNAPINTVWTVLAEEFTQIATWLDAVVRAYEIPNLRPIEGAPVGGRICEFSDKEDGMAAREEIIVYDEANHHLAIEVEVLNAPAVFPVKKNVAHFYLSEAGDKTAVRLEVSPELKAHGFVMYPVLKMGLAKQFRGLLTKMGAHAEERVAVAA